MSWQPFSSLEVELLSLNYGLVFGRFRCQTLPAHWTRILLIGTSLTIFPPLFDSCLAHFAWTRVSSQGILCLGAKQLVLSVSWERVESMLSVFTYLANASVPHCRTASLGLSIPSPPKRAGWGAVVHVRLALHSRSGKLGILELFLAFCADHFGQRPGGVV